MKAADRGMMGRLRAVSIPLMMMVSFIVSYAIMGWQGHPAGPVHADVAPIPTVPATHPASSVFSEPRFAQTQAAATGGQPSINAAAVAQKQGSPPANVSGNAVPVVVNIRKWGGGQRYWGDIQSSAQESMTVTLSVLSPGSGQPAELTLTLAPGERRQFVSGDAFQLHANDQLVVQSPPYTERFERVP